MAAEHRVAGSAQAGVADLVAALLADGDTRAAAMLPRKRP